MQSDNRTVSTPQADLNGRHNIAWYHREHMRFNANLILEMGVDIGREANRLKVFGNYWQREPETPYTPPFDTSDRRFSAAGCPDLNPLAAVAGAGILFMEGGGEPEEIRLLKSKLKFEGDRFVNKGQWLVNIMHLTWKADLPLLDPATPGAWPWASVVSLTLRGAKQRRMAGTMMLVALDHLEQVDFTPAALRENRAEAGKRLLAAAWAMDEASRLFAENAASLTHDDPYMHDYLDFFANPTAR